MTWYIKLRNSSLTPCICMCLSRKIIVDARNEVIAERAMKVSAKQLGME